MNTSKPNFLSVNDFVVSTGLSTSTVFRKIKAKKIPFTRIGRKILIPISFIKELEEKAIVSTKTEA
jgi:excisionase family DNA binding protein